MELYVNLNTQINVEVCRCCCYVKQILLSCMHTCLGSTFVASFDTKPRVLKTIDRRHLVESAFSIQNLLQRHYAKRELTPRSLNVKLGPRRNYHKGRAAIRHYANQTARPL